jgi:hypothetical protein
MTRPSFLRSRTVLALLLLPVLTLAVACGGGGGSSSPTDPGNPSTPLGSASVSGEIDVAGGGSGNLSSGLSSISGAGQSGAGVTVRIQGTDLSTTADAAGSFRLDGVPHGNQVVVFETSAASAGVPVDSIQPQEAIEIDVELEGSNARVKKLQRNGGTEGEGPDELHLSLQLSPNTWNTNYDHSAGTVTAFKILGVSLDDESSHKEFADKYSLPFPLLADTAGTASDAYGVKAKMYGAIMAKRQTFLIDPEGRIAKHYVAVDPKEHSAELLADLEEFSNR